MYVDELGQRLIQIEINHRRGVNSTSAPENDDVLAPVSTGSRCRITPNGIYLYCVSRRMKWKILKESGFTKKRKALYRI